MAAGEPTGPTDGVEDADDEAADLEALRARVEAKYDFEDFRPADMAEMSLEEWEAVFDADTWITGEALLDRVDAELRRRVADGELFAVVERRTEDGDPRVLAYSDVEYVLVGPDGTVRGEGSLLEAIEPVVALCSLESYEVAEPPEGAALPDPATVEPGSGDLGHRVVLVLAVVLLGAGAVVLVSPLALRLGPGSGALTTVVGLGFLGIGVVLGVLVANARLSDRFRAAEFRERLEAAGVGTDERPAFLPPLDGPEEGAPEDGS